MVDTITTKLLPTPQCRCVGKHIPKTMFTVPYYMWPEHAGGKGEERYLIWLCPTTRFNIDQLWDLYEIHNGRPPWSLLKNYSEYARYVVEKGRDLRRSSQLPTSTN